MKKTTQSDLDEFYAAVLCLRTKTEAARFFRDLLTSSEISEFARRWKTARLLSDEVPYTRIVQETGVSSTTVARVARWLRRGTGGYSLILRRLRHTR